MSIDIERFEEEDPEVFENPTNAERVIAFLVRNDDRAWKQAEIADQAGVKRGSIGPVLRRLHEQGLVRHKGEYWAITNDRERLAATIDLHRISDSLDERHGEERKSEWISDADEPSGGEG